MKFQFLFKDKYMLTESNNYNSQQNNNLHDNLKVKQ